MPEPTADKRAKHGARTRKDNWPRGFFDTNQNATRSGMRGERARAAADERMGSRKTKGEGRVFILQTVASLGRFGRQFWTAHVFLCFVFMMYVALGVTLQSTGSFFKQCHPH